MPGRVICDSADRRLFESEVRVESRADGAENADGLLYDLRSDPIARQHRYGLTHRRLVPRSLSDISPQKLQVVAKPHCAPERRRIGIRRRDEELDRRHAA